MSDPSISYRLNPTKDVDLRVLVFSGSGDEDFVSYSSLLVTLSCGVKTISQSINLEDKYKRVDVDFKDLNNSLLDLDNEKTNFKIKAILEKKNSYQDVRLVVNQVGYKNRPADDSFDMEIFSTANTDGNNMTRTPYVNVILKENDNINIFEDVTNVTLILETDLNTSNETCLQYSIPLQNGITNSDVNIYFNKIINDISNEIFLETSGNAISNGSLQYDNIERVEIDPTLFVNSLFSKDLYVTVVLQTSYGITSNRKGHTISRGANAPQLLNLKTNISDHQFNELYINLDIKPNSLDTNGEIINGQEIIKYELDLYEKEYGSLDASYTLVFNKKIDLSNNVLVDNTLSPTNDITLKINEDGVISYNDMPDVHTGTTLQAKFVYKLTVTPINASFVTSPPSKQSAVFLLEKASTFSIHSIEYPTFFNYLVGNYDISYNVEIVHNTIENADLTPKLRYIYHDLDVNQLTTSYKILSNANSYSIDENKTILGTFDLTNERNTLMTTAFIPELDISNNYKNPTDLGDNTIFNQSAFDVSGTSQNDFRSLQYVYDESALDEPVITLLDNSGNPDGFKITFKPNVIIHELGISGENDHQKNVFNELSLGDKNDLLTKINNVEIFLEDLTDKFSNGANGDYLPVSSDNTIPTTGGLKLDINGGVNDDYIITLNGDVSGTKYLGHKFNYHFSLDTPINEIGTLSRKAVYNNVRVNDVGILDLNTNGNTFTIENFMGFKLLSATYLNFSSGEFTIIYQDGTKVTTEYNISGEEIDDPRFELTRNVNAKDLTRVDLVGNSTLGEETVIMSAIGF